jgi:putative transposase
MAEFRSFQYLLQPTARQARALEHLLGVQCEAYNAAVEERREAWKRGTRITRYDQFAQLKDLHEIRPDFLQYGVTVARGTLTRLDRAFSAFFRRVAAGQKPGFPRFRASSRFDCVSYEDVSGWKLKEPDHRLYLQGIGHVKIKLHRPLRGVPKTLHVRRQGRRWSATIQCAGVPARALPPTDTQAGFDLGVANLAASSDGEFFENPRHLAGAGRRCPPPSGASPASSGAPTVEGRPCAGWPPSTAGSPTGAGTASTSSPGGSWTAMTSRCSKT